MRTTLYRTAAATAVCGVGLTAFTQSPLVPHAQAAGTRSHVTLAIGHNFPDPGFAKFGSTYYLYSTGDGFPAAASSSPGTGYTSVGNTTPTGNWPSWNGVAPKFGRHHWAPHVFQSKDASGKPLYVMYFTAWNKQAGWNNDCIGIASSSSPKGRFAYKGRVCTAKGYEAIDPSMYQAKNGKRYLVYKKGRYSNPRFFSVVSVPVDATSGTKVISGARLRLASSTSEVMEAPTFVAHGGKVWMFVSRGSFQDSTYRTEAWSAPSFQDPGGFKKVKNLTMNNSAGNPFIGPGGATVIQDGATTRVAFHAYTDHSYKTRRAYVGVIKWDAAGKPYLY